MLGSNIYQSISNFVVIGIRILLLITSIGIDLFKINAKKLHYGLRIPLKYMKQMHDQSLEIFQEKFNTYWIYFH